MFVFGDFFCFDFGSNFEVFKDGVVLVDVDCFLFRSLDLIFIVCIQWFYICNGRMGEL